MATYGGPDDARPLTLKEFDALFRRLRDATAWGPDDRRGALNNLTPSHVLAAVGEVRSGHTVSLAAPIETVASPDNPDPCSHEMAGEVGEPAAHRRPVPRHLQPDAVQRSGPRHCGGR